MTSGSGVPDKRKVKSTVLKIAEFLKEKRAEEVLVLDLDGLTTITDFFIICTVRSSVQTKALVRSIEELLHDAPFKPLTRNIGYESPWVLLDYNHFIVHIFLKEGRNYYQLEKFWSDAKVMYSHQGSFL